MNREIYRKNMEAIWKKYPAWAVLINNTKRKKRGFDVIAEESMMGDTILKVNDNGRLLYLNGRYAPSMPVERWLESQGKIEEYSPVVIVGIANGYHIRRIMESVPKTSNILIYEPSMELFRRALQEVDLSFLFEPDAPIGVIVEGLNESERMAYFHFMISFDNMTSLKCYVSGNYPKLFPEKVGDFIKELKKYVENVEIKWNTLVRYTNVKAENTFRNLPYLYEGYNVLDLEGMLPPDVPAIIVSAGPSLNKNIKDLKKAVGKACIIATDTAMKPLLNAGIVPNLFVIIDGLKPGLLFEHKDISKVPMVTMTGVSVDPMKYHKGKKFFYSSGSQIEKKILLDITKKERRNRMLEDLMTGGSVAHSAYTVGVLMGAKTVILIGQDLAMTGNRTHADGTFKDKMDEIDVDSGEYFEVDAVGGGKVLTRNDFDRYRIWFEDQAKADNGITIVDATEGGALIHGTKVMTLKSAIKKYCKREFNVKWHVDRIHKLFEGENKKIALDYFASAEKKLDEVKKKAKEGIRYYERLEKLLLKPSVTDGELQKVLKRIKKINNYIENDYMAETVVDSLQGLEYIFRTSIYQMKEDRSEELREIAEQGKTLLFGVTVGADEIAGIARDTIVPFAEKELEKMKNNGEKADKGNGDRRK